MTWLVRSRVQPGTATAAAVLSIVCALIESRAVPVPRFGSWLTMTVTVSMLAPALLASALGAMIAVGHERETFATRPLGLLDRTLVVVLTMTALTPPALAWAALGDSGAVVAARNTVGFFGLTLLSRRVAAPIIVTATPVVAALAFLVLSSLSPSLYVQWPFDEAHSAAAAAVALAIWTGGVAFGSGAAAIRHQATYP